LNLVLEDALALLYLSELREPVEDFQELFKADVRPVDVVDYLQELVRMQLGDVGVEPS